MLRCYITDRRLLREESLEQAIQRLAPSVDWIQLREKDLPARELLRLASLAPAKVIVNSRMDVALAACARGLHLPAGSAPPRWWRRLAPKGFQIGVSCHTVEEVRQAEVDGADYVYFGPVFAPLSKSSDLVPRGLEGLEAAARAVSIPVLALGGITFDKADSCVAAGAAGIAGISLFQLA